MDDRSFEDKLRYQLHDAVADVGAAPLPRAAARRARLRQSFAVAAVFLVAIAVGGTTLALLTTEKKRPNVSRVAAPDGVDDKRGSGGTFPCQHPELDGECIAHGEYDGTKWWIGAHMEGDDLCTSDVQEDRDGLGGSGMGCGPYNPDKIGFGVTSAEDYPDGIASGEVASSVDTLVLERSEGPALELELYPAPKGFPLDVFFYNVFLPHDASALIAYDAQGNVVARQDIDRNEFPLHHPQVVNPRAEISSGDVGGHPWTFSVREEVTNVEITPCTEVTFGEQEGFGGGGGCHVGVPDERPLGFSQSSFDSGPAMIVIFGAVDARAAEVKVELDSGGSYAAQLLNGPQGFRGDVSYFVVWIPRDGAPNPPGRIIAVDAYGNEVGTEDLCGEIAFEGGTCGN